MADRTPFEKVRLLLEKPSPGALYSYPRPEMMDVSQSRGGEPAPASSGARLLHPTATAIRILITNLQEPERTAAEQAVFFWPQAHNQDLIGALIIDLGLSKHLSPTFDAHTIKSLATGIKAAIVSRPAAPSESELDQIKKWATDVKKLIPETTGSLGLRKIGSTGFYCDSLLGVIRDVERSRIQNELLGFENPMIDRDRRELLGRLESLSVDSAALALLHDADAEAAQGKFEDGLHELRKFLEQVMKTVTKDTVTETGGARFKIRKDQASSQKLVSADEAELLQKLYNLLSNAGSHALGSKAELYSVCRATVIEWCLLLTGRFASHSPHPSAQLDDLA